MSESIGTYNLGQEMTAQDRLDKIMAEATIASVLSGYPHDNLSPIGCPWFDEGGEGG